MKTKRKILNDPLYGFITIPGDLIFEIIEHPYFQRLRRIRQLGLGDLVYPGAVHSRFHHAIGAMHLMEKVLESLRLKGHEISDQEFESALIAILLHDIGHGPFSHVLEHAILNKVHHEDISLLIIKHLNIIFDNKLALAIKIFEGTYDRHFFHQLVSSQLDLDRMDYLNRDSYFSGVTEGVVSNERITHMFDIVQDEIVIEEKGVFSVENFLNSRRLMYWQVYLHKTIIAAEEMLIQIVKRAKYLCQNHVNIITTPSLQLFLQKNISFTEFDHQVLEHFTQMDDYDLWGSIKIWQHHSDIVLSMLCKKLLNRDLFKNHLSNTEYGTLYIEMVDAKLKQHYKINDEELAFIRSTGTLTNLGYISSGNKIKVMRKNGEIIDISEISDLPNIKAISEIVKKYYLCCPKEGLRQ